MHEAANGKPLPTGLPRSRGSSGGGATIAGIIHGIDADIFRDPASIQRQERDRRATLRTSNGILVGIDLPPDAPKGDGSDDPGFRKP